MRKRFWSSPISHRKNDDASKKLIWSVVNASKKRFWSAFAFGKQFWLAFGREHFSLAFTFEKNNTFDPDQIHTYMYVFSTRRHFFEVKLGWIKSVFSCISVTWLHQPTGLNVGPPCSGSILNVHGPFQMDQNSAHLNSTRNGSYEGYHEMPQKACERWFFHVIPFS